MVLAVEEVEGSVLVDDDRVAGRGRTRGAPCQTAVGERGQDTFARPTDGRGLDRNDARDGAGDVEVLDLDAGDAKRDRVGAGERRSDFDSLQVEREK